MTIVITLCVMAVMGLLMYVGTRYPVAVVSCVAFTFVFAMVYMLVSLFMEPQIGM